jgi:primary-amine oxidase
LEAEAIARADPRVQQLLEERGITDPAQLACDPWAIHACPEEWQGRRLMQVFTYYKEGPDDNEYAHPMDVTPVVDLYSRQVRGLYCTGQDRAGGGADRGRGGRQERARLTAHGTPIPQEN